MAGTFTLLAPPEQTGGFPVYSRPRDLFTEDGTRFYSEVGWVEDRPETYAGAAGGEGRATSTGLRVGRLAVADGVPEKFKPGGPMGTVEWERKEAWIKFDADGNLVDTSERLTTEQLAALDAEFKKVGWAGPPLWPIVRSAHTLPWFIVPTGGRSAETIPVL
jgi:hypothetical protein